MKSIASSSINSRLDLRLAAYAAAGVALAAPALIPTANADIIYSGPLTLAVPMTLDGLYLDFVTGVSSTASFTGYDINPFGTTALEFYSPTGSAVVGTTAAGATALAPGTTISSASTFKTSVATGAAFDTIGTEFLGVKFTNDTTLGTDYGWVEFVTTSATGFPATIIGYAYNNTTGGAIAAGQIINAVPEPTTSAALGFGALSLGAAGLRRWRKAKQAVA